MSNSKSNPNLSPKSGPRSISDSSNGGSEEGDSGRSLSRAQTRYRETVRVLSDRLVKAQKPIRILDAIAWDDGVREAFFAADGRQQPKVDREYYDGRTLRFDPAEKRAELEAIARDAASTLGPVNPVTGILQRMCEEYVDVVSMLEARGTDQFAALSRQLYGSPHDAFHPGEPTLADLGALLAGVLDNIDDSAVLEPPNKYLQGQAAVDYLAERLEGVFGDGTRSEVSVKLSDGIVADAAAGSTYIKLKENVAFSERDLRLLEVHEGWVHLGTSLNGRSQTVCTFLSKAPPSVTVNQEGLAVLVEVLAFASHPGRLRKLASRIRATAMAEEGSTFLDVYRLFEEQGYDKSDSFHNATRVFRGSLPTAGPFTKDISYTKGFVLIYNYLRLVVQRGLLRRIPLMFVGKTRIEDIKLLEQLLDDQILDSPRFLPPQFADPEGLVSWLAMSGFLNQLDLAAVQMDFDSIL